MAFFRDLPPDDRWPDDAPEPVRPAWDGPPRAVLGAVVPQGEVLVATDHLVIALGSLTAYPTGLSLDIVLGLRWGDLDGDSWEELSTPFWGERPPVRRSRPTGDVLRWGVELEDGRRAESAWWPGSAPGGQPEAPALREQGGGASGGRSMMDRRVKLWLWPLPEGTSFTLALQWPALGVPETFHRIDLAPVRAAADRAIPYWSSQGEG